MAQLLNESLRAPGGRVPGKQKRYPWHDWLNGQPWKIEPGVDFAVSVAAMRSCIYQAAKRLGVAVVTELYGPSGREAIHLQAFPKQNGDDA